MRFGFNDIHKLQRQTCGERWKPHRLVTFIVLNYAFMALPAFFEYEAVFCCCLYIHPEPTCSFIKSHYSPFPLFDCKAASYIINFSLLCFYRAPVNEVRLCRQNDLKIFFLPLSNMPDIAFTWDKLE